MPRHLQQTPRRSRSAKPGRTRTLRTYSRRGGSGDVDIADRVVASLPYLLPLLDSLRYGVQT